MSKIYVGNLSWSTTDTTLGDFFSSHGEVVEAIVMCDRETGRSRGFGFVTFAAEDGATNATQAEGLELDGRGLKVNLANDRSSGGGGGYRTGYGGGGGNSGGGNRRTNDNDNGYGGYRNGYGNGGYRNEKHGDGGYRNEKDDDHNSGYRNGAGYGQ